MNILFATSEVAGFAKTGGLADVAAALPIELRRMGHRPIIFMPAYRKATDSDNPIESLGVRIEIPIGSKTVTGGLLKSHLPGSDVPVYLVEQDEYYDRDELYVEGGEDYKDNCERFVFFCRAIIESIRLLELKVDLLHCNDWQTGLLPAYLKTEYSSVPGYERIATLFTIHNLAYQGTFWHWDMVLTGLDWKYFNYHQMEFYGNLNLMKTGLVFADALATVSPRYAEEIQTSPLGCGLEGVLQNRREVLSGIVNGVDYERWNPATDSDLAANFGPDDVQVGKAQCKAALQKEVGLPSRADVPLIGLVGRLVDQKGFDLLEPVISQWIEHEDAQWVILGTGDAKYEAMLAKAAERYPQKIAALLSFSEPLAHRIEAGADMFMMPSLYEPCGLNQLYSLKYGTIPIVRATGGLADTITDAGEDSLAAGTANGFSFRDYGELSLSKTLGRAVDTYHTNPDRWKQLIDTAMRQDWSWAHSARQYVELYQATLARRQQTATLSAR